ncbi:MAG: sulfite exporter TauE/SafE family protein [archaeon]
MKIPEVNEKTAPRKKGNLIRKNIKINGMICESCEKIIEKSLGKIDGVKHIKVDYVNSTAKIDYNPKKATMEEIQNAIKAAGYDLKLDKKKDQKVGNNKIAYVAIGLVALGLLIISYFIATIWLSGMNLSIPQLDSNTGAVIILAVGLLTGFHCIGMCGGFVLSYTAKARQENPKSLNIGLHGQYAIGKIISYTIIGGIFGLIGSVFIFSPELRAIIAIFAGAFLILYALKMLNVHPVLRKLSIPQGIFSKLRVGPLKKSSNPLAIGLANGLFIACGPLQAMYILAMTTGSFFGGATILFAFAIGTLIPMLGFGIFASFISRGMQNNIVRVSAIVVLVMGILMINNGLALTGNSINFSTQGNLFGSEVLPTSTNTLTTPTTGTTNNGTGYQVINMDVTGAGYSPNSFVLKTGVPVKWVINGKEITSCNGAITVPAYKLNFNIKQGEQTIEFTPPLAGTIQWSCWMGMIQGSFIVRDDVSIDQNGKVILTSQVQQQATAQTAAAPKTSGGCGCAMMKSGTQSCH